MSAPNPQAAKVLTDPLKFFKLLWPDRVLYREQREIVVSIRDADETYVPAGNQLGKDFIAGAIATMFFVNPMCFFPRRYVQSVERTRNETNTFPHTRRILTTSVKDEHLDVLWGEIGTAMSSASDALGRLTGKGGLLVVNDKEVRFAWEKDRTTGNVVNFLRGQVSKGPEGMSGHHAAYTMLIGDEASGLDNGVHDAALGWARRFLYIGNPWPCENFFRKACDAGDLLAS